MAIPRDSDPPRCAKTGKRPALFTVSENVGASALRLGARAAPIDVDQPAATGTPSFSIRIAVALNSAVPDLGSVASIVRRLTSTSSG